MYIDARVSTHDELNILHCCFCDSLIIRLHNLRSGDSTTLEVEIYNLWIYSSTLEVENPQPWKWKSTTFEVEMYSTTLEVERTMLYWLLMIKVFCFYLNCMSVICRCHRCGTCMLQLIFMILFFVYFLLPNHFATTQSFVNVWPISVVGSSITGEVSRSLLF